METFQNIITILFVTFVISAVSYIIYLSTQINFNSHQYMMIEHCLLPKRKIIKFKKFKQLFEEYDEKYDYKNNNDSVNNGIYFFKDSIVVLNEKKWLNPKVYLHADIIQFDDTGYILANSWEYHKYRKFFKNYCKNNFKKDLTN